jgi:hypothetical protein
MSAVQNWLLTNISRNELQLLREVHKIMNIKTAVEMSTGKYETKRNRAEKM